MRVLWRPGGCSAALSRTVGRTSRCATFFHSSCVLTCGQVTCWPLLSVPWSRERTAKGRLVAEKPRGSKASAPWDGDRKCIIRKAFSRDGELVRVFENPFPDPTGAVLRPLLRTLYYNASHALIGMNYGRHIKCKPRVEHERFLKQRLIHFP